MSTMKLLHWSLVLGSPLLQRAVVAPDSSGNDATEEQGHIVVLKKDLPIEHIDKHIHWVNDMHKSSLGSRDGTNQEKGIQHTYRSESTGFHGYEGKFSDEVLQMIRDHGHVDFMEEDRIITVPNTKREEVESDKSPESVGNKNQNKGVGLLTRGQGYNTFLDKGRVVDAIVWPSDGKRDVENGLVQAGVARFNFSPPSINAEDFKGVNLKD